MEGLKNIKVLLVDDDQGICTLIKTYLESRGMSVMATLSGIDALNIFQGNRNFDILITDIQMNGMDGLELFQKIKQLDKNFPVMFISGCVDIESMFNALGMETQEYLLKPFDTLEELLVPIDKCVKKHRELFN